MRILDKLFRSVLWVCVRLWSAVMVVFFAGWIAARIWARY
jgi:hypothetical protein